MSDLGQFIHLKKEILVRIIKAFLSDDFARKARLIPYDMRPKGMEVPYRCCVYKERAIIKDRAIAGLGFPIEEDDETVSLSDYATWALERTQISDKNLTVLQTACKGCATNRIYVTDLCQGCVARPCQSACKFGAISIIDGKSVIDDSKCKKCQKCVGVCPYKAITKISVPCEDSCPVGAIKKDETGFASIDYDKCINCGKCVTACPFCAVHERSQIVDILKAIKSDKKVIAMIAPSIAGQFNANIYQLKSAIIKSGFDDVYEVAQGADITAKNEAKEFVERMKAVNEKESDWLTEWANVGGYGEQELQDDDEKLHTFMTTSCCAGYNQLVKKHLQEIKPFVSDTKTPLYYTAEIVKKEYPECITVFVSPCVAKRAESFDNPNVDYVMNYEELESLFTAKEIKIEECEEQKYTVESSKQARKFGISGGVAESIKASLQDENAVKPFIINGLNKDSIKQLKKYADCGECEQGCNLIEVMCCEGGCIGGNAALLNQKTAKKLIDELAENSDNISKI